METRTVRHITVSDDRRPGRVGNPKAIITPSTLEALASAKSVTGEVKDVSGTAQGILAIQTEQGVVHCTVDQFGDAYRGMVRLWPVIASIRDKQDSKRKVQAAHARESAKAAAKAAKVSAMRQAKAAKKASKK